MVGACLGSYLGTVISLLPSSMLQLLLLLHIPPSLFPPSPSSFPHPYSSFSPPSFPLPSPLMFWLCS